MHLATYSDSPRFFSTVFRKVYDRRRRYATVISKLRLYRNITEIIVMTIPDFDAYRSGFPVCRIRYHRTLPPKAKQKAQSRAVVIFRK